MKLRKIIIIILGVIVALSVSLSSLSIYHVAREKLIGSARRSLEHEAAVVRSRIRLRFDLLTQRVHSWSLSPYVREVVENPHDPEKVKKLNQAFAVFVKSDSILQTLNLMDRNAECIASSIPERIGLVEMREVVSRREDFLKALDNMTGIKGAFMAVSSGRPIVAISVPVLIGQKVEAVLRLIIDVQWFGNFFGADTESDSRDDVFVFSPQLDLNKYAGHNFTLVIKTPYKKPDVPDVVPDFETGRGIVSYKRDNQQRMAACLWMDNPRWVIVVDRPLTDILRPIKSVRYTVMIIASALFVFVWFLSGLTVRPLMSGIGSCLDMVRRFGDGDYNVRTGKVSSADIAELASGLNSMASRIESQNRILQASEAKYRNIFETAAEGIFQTDRNGKIISANPAMLRILGAGSSDDLLNVSADDFYVDPDARSRAMEILHATGRLANFEFRLRGLDGGIRDCRVRAVEEYDASGQTRILQGIMSDITAEKQAAKDRERAREAEKLLLEARFRTLRYQLNPHFLFNVLNTIDVFARRSPEKIGDLIRKLSGHLRDTLNPRDEMLLPLHMELKTVRSYLAVEEVRFQGQLAVEMNINPDTGEIPVPDLILQPLVENAIKYGRMTSPDILGLVIEADLHDDRLEIIVSNTGRLVESRKDSTGLGLANLRERLGLVYGPDFRFELEEINGWVKASLVLPANPPED